MDPTSFLCSPFPSPSPPPSSSSEEGSAVGGSIPLPYTHTAIECPLRSKVCLAKLRMSERETGERERRRRCFLSQSYLLRLISRHSREVSCDMLVSFSWISAMSADLWLVKVCSDMVVRFVRKERMNRLADRSRAAGSLRELWIMTLIPSTGGGREPHKGLILHATMYPSCSLVLSWLKQGSEIIVPSSAARTSCSMPCWGI
mmetsp:Transcript_28528/g.92059  ORF Transcript_28528/g.92059 Transcript_28528/m.92059 type:complete len:202 (+) Transcript_28528:1445-2050(+)